MMAGLWLAIGFLTRVPVPNADFQAATLARSVFWFPGVGLVLGVAVASLLTLGQSFFNPWAAAFLALTVWVLFTGGLHLDGVADTFDGLSASTELARGLAVMKDSRIGAHGALALLGVVLGKYIALLQLGVPWSTGRAWTALLLATVWARLLVGFAMTQVKPASTSTLGAMFHHALHPRYAWFSSVWLIPLLVLVICLTSVWQMRTVALVAVLGGALVAWCLVRVCVRRFGGVTGDTHGALIELVELVTLFVWGLRV